MSQPTNTFFTKDFQIALIANMVRDEDLFRTTSYLKLTDIDMEPCRLVLETLRDYWRHHRPNLNGYLFPAATQLGHACPETVRKVFRKALVDANIKKRVTPHVLRHCFATHLLECGVDVTVVQALLGHRSLRTTENYTHISTEHIATVRSPLDVLGTPDSKILG